MNKKENKEDNKKEKVVCCVLGVGVDTGKVLLLPNRFILELPQEVNLEIAKIINEHPLTAGKLKQFIIKETDYNYKEIK